MTKYTTDVFLWAVALFCAGIGEPIVLTVALVIWALIRI